MLLAELTAEFQWGLLLVTDVNSTEQIPEWTSADEQVTAVSSALVVRVMSDAEGEVAICVVNDPAEAKGTRIFSGHLDVPSKVLQVGDALGAQAVRVAIEEGAVDIEVFLDEPIEAARVTLLICCRLPYAGYFDICGCGGAGR